MIWNAVKNNFFKVRIYEKELRISRIMASILLSLGVTLDESRALLNEPQELLDTESKICGEEEIVRHLLDQENRTVKIFADYDVDGLMSGYILNDYLSSIGLNSEVYYPSREEGYGLNIDWTKKVAEENDPSKLTVITIDNGITAHEPVKFLRDKGAQVYIIDHHEPIDVNSLPDANAICDAWIDRKYGTHLCAAAVALKIVYHMEKKYPDEVLTAYMPFAALATISDVMPGCPENRAIVQLGLNIINMMYEESPLYALLKSKGLKKLRAKDVAWNIAPMINACSRMNEIETAKRLLEKYDIIVSKEGPVDLNGFGDTVFGHFDDKTKKIQVAANKGFLRIANMANCFALTVPSGELSTAYVILCDSNNVSAIRKSFLIAESLYRENDALSERYFLNYKNYFMNGYSN